MTTNLLFAVGTLLTWAGWLFALLTLVAAARIALAGGDKAVGSRALMGNALLAALGLGFGTVLTPGATPGFRFPLVWFVMPYTAWITVAGIAIAALMVIRSFLALNAEERNKHLKPAAGWTGAFIIAAVLYKADPDSKIEVFTGGIPLDTNTIVTILLLAVAGVAAMVRAEVNATTRGMAKGFASQVALLVGSVVFGLPFAFLVITSFKEDRDMSSPNGIVWIPKVQDKMPYNDPANPLYETVYKGQTVQGELIEKRPDGSVRLDIFKPLAIRGTTFDAPESALKTVPRDIDVVTAKFEGQPVTGMVIKDLDDGRRVVQVTSPANLAGKQATYQASEVEPVRHVGLRTENYSEALSFLPPETNGGLVYVRNTLIIVVMSVLGTVLSSSLVAYAFSRMRFPGKEAMFTLLLSTMMLPAAVTMLPQFLIFRSLGWIDTLYPLWVPAFFGSAFNIFLLRQFFMQIPMELEDAAKIDGCTYVKTFWDIMLPQIKPALAVISVWTFVGAWNNFMGPLIYINSPENMPLSYALNLFQGDRSGEPGLLMAFATLTILPVLALFFFAQRYFIEGVTLSGLGGR